MRPLSVIVVALLMGWALPGVRAESSSDRQAARYSQFESALRKDGIEAAHSLLLEWQTTAPTDVQLAVAWGNFHIAEAMRHSHAVYAVPKGTRPNGFLKGVYPMTKEGSKEIEGAFDTRPRYDTAILTKTVAILREAVTTHPERLDIWMGMAHVQLLAEDWDAAFETLAGMTVHAKDHPNGLQFTMGRPIDAPADKYVPGKLHDYVLRVHDAGTTGALEFVLRIAKLAQTHYPKSAIGYNDEALYRYETGNRQEALDALLKAHFADQSDCIVMMNIAAHHVKDGDRLQAQELYQQVVDRATDPAVKSDATELLGRLRSGRQE